jgi:DNA-binding CsgD family transcriptional regulator
MMQTTFALSEIAESFASAAIDPSRWNEALESAARATGSFGALMFPVHPTQGGLPTVPTTDSMRRITEAYIADGWIHRDERYRGVPTMLRNGVASEFDFISPEAIARNAYYQEFLAPRKMQWFAAVKVGDHDHVWALSLNRSIEQGPFIPEELARLAALSRRIAGVVALSRAFGFARVEAALQAFEISGSAVAMIGSSGEVVKLNSSAERLLGDDLKIIRGRIVCGDREATAALDRALHGLIWSRQSDALHPPIVLPRRIGRPIIAYPSRLNGIAADGFTHCQGLIAFIDLEERLGGAPGDIAAAFGLTPAEARLAHRLAGDDSIEAAAHGLGVARETARNQLKSVFQKTDTHRQSHLVSLLARFPRRRVEK